MKEKVRFEFFFQEKKFFNRRRIIQKIKNMVKQTYHSDIKIFRSYDGIDRLNNFYKGFYSFELNIGEDEKAAAWDLTQEVCDIDGIIGGGPLLPIRRKKKEKMKEAKKEAIEKSKDLRWNHKLTFFDDAIKKARQDGRLVGEKNTGIRIVQLDTGYTRHEDVYKALDLRNDRNFLEKNKRKDAFDPVPERERLNPGHGTTTAGIIIGRGVKTGEAYNEGLFPWVTFIPYRMTTSVIEIGGGMLSASIRHAVDKAKCNIIVMSIGGIPLFSDWEAAINYAYRKGVIITASAGNYVKFVVWPARFKNVIGVGGINPDGTPWQGSCKGKEVNISAPAGLVYVARAERINKKLEFFYESTNGTSFSSPHIAAAAALWLHYFRKELEDDFYRKAPWRKVDAFTYVLYKSATKPGDWKKKHMKDFGVGILNVLGLLQYNPLDKKVKDAILGKGDVDTSLDYNRVSFEKKSYDESLKRIELLYELGKDDDELSDDSSSDDALSEPELIKKRVRSMTAAYSGKILHTEKIREKGKDMVRINKEDSCNRIADELTQNLPKCIVEKRT